MAIMSKNVASIRTAYGCLLLTVGNFDLLFRKKKCLRRKKYYNEWMNHISEAANSITEILIRRKNVEHENFVKKIMLTSLFKLDYRNFFTKRFWCLYKVFHEENTLAFVCVCVCVCMFVTLFTFSLSEICR